MTFAQILKSIYKEYNVDFCFVADHLGIPDETVQDWEKGKTKPNAEEMKKFSEMFALPMHVLEKAL